MRRVKILIAVMAIGFVAHGGVWPSDSALVTPAYAQSVDHDAILLALVDMKRDINKMMQLVARHQNASLTVGDETVTLSSGQLSQIISRYNTLKAGLAAKYQALP